MALGKGVLAVATGRLAAHRTGKRGRCEQVGHNGRMSAVITSDDSSAHEGTASIEPVQQGVSLFAYRWVLVVATLLFLLDIAYSNRYGFHRDELYFLDCARHLQGGDVDQPAFVPLLARISLALFGDEPSGVACLGRTGSGGNGYRRRPDRSGAQGGGRGAQVVMAIAVACMPSLITAGDLLEPTTFDVLFWSALTLVLLRIARTGDKRYWLLAGFVLGLGLANKHSIGFFAGAVVIGLIFSGGWRMLLNRWALAGLAIAIVFTLPDVIWQAEHGWPTIAMTHALNQENGGLGNIPTWVIGQLLMVNIFFLWLWIKGLRVLWRLATPMSLRTRLGVRDSVRRIRFDDGWEDLLPGGSIRFPAGGGSRRHGRVLVAAQGSHGIARSRRLCDHGLRLADRTSHPASKQDQRVHFAQFGAFGRGWVASARPHGGSGLQATSGPRASQRRHFRVQLR